MFKKFIFCIFLGCVLMSCNNQNNKKETIKLGTSPDYPPFEFKHNGEIIGFDIDLARAIAAHLNKELEIYEFDFSGLLPALEAGKIDCAISGFTVTKERSANVDFSNVYYQASIAGIAKENIDINDFNNKRIGAQLGSIMESFALNKQKEFSNVQVVSLANNLHLLQELKLNRIDILMLEEGQVEEILSSNPGLKAHIFENYGEGYAIAFPKNSSLVGQFNKALEELQNDGEILKLTAKYLKNKSNFIDNSNQQTNFVKALTIIPSGILITLEYAIISVFLGFIIGSIISLARLSSIKILKFMAIIYVSLVRGTPLLLQLFMVYFVFPVLFNVDISAFAAGIIAFSMNSGAYVSENIRAGIESVDKGQFEAAKSLGMSYRVMMQYIIMPQALRNILPSLVNESINMVKESSIISVIGEADIMRRANIVAAEQYSYLEPLLIAAVCYYCLVLCLSIIGSKLEKRLKNI